MLERGEPRVLELSGIILDITNVGKLLRVLHAGNARELGGSA